MEKTQTLEEFYQSKINWIPESLKREMGHFNVFRLDDFVGKHARPIPFSRRDYYKITFFTNAVRLHYADKTVSTAAPTILFANPLVPYNWEGLEAEQHGFFCIFTESFFNQFGNIKEYPVFQPGGTPVFMLETAEACETIKAIYQSMFTEITSDYRFKYDVLRNKVYELVHAAMKMQPATATLYTESNARVRLTGLFTELLERQFPIESPAQRIKLKAPAEFAHYLCIHVNHLNRALKDITGKTTSQMVAERIAQEARMLLKHTNWNISEIAWSLGFDDLSHFIYFFKRNTQITPNQYRQ